MKFLIRLLKKIGLLDHVLFNVQSEIHQKRYTIPLQGKMGLENIFLVESWAIKLLAAMLSKLDKHTYFVDIGVNIGQTLLKVKSVDENINYIGFEPNPTCVSYVNTLIKENQLTNTSIYPLGLSDEDGILSLFADNAYASGASVIENFRKSAKIAYKLHIPVIKGDNFFKTFEGEIGIIKIDVEGFESSVLQGLEETLAIHTPFIICEVLPVYSETNLPRLSRQKSLEELLKRCSYSIYLINETNVSLQEIAEIGVHGDMGRTNYVFCHHTKKELLAELVVG